MLVLMGCVYVLAVLELDTDTEGPAKTQENGDLIVDNQTQMTSFEMNLKDKRFVTAVAKPLGFMSSSGCIFIHLIDMYDTCISVQVPG